MDANKLSSVRIAVKEAPSTIRGNVGPNSQHSIVQYPTECPNSLIVGGNVYSFDCAFRPTVTQKEVYHELIQPLVEKAMAGIDCTVLAYGQTGTGKSYSMGLAYTDFSEEQHLGIAPRCLKEILQRLSQNQENRFVSPQIFASFIEIYNEKAFDLHQDKTAQPIYSRGQRFCGGVRMPIRSEQDLQNLLILGTQNRHVRPTNMNENSSRSHAILTIYIQLTEFSNMVRFNIVDLAGSEGVRRTGHEGVARQEGVYINQGILAVNKVLMSMSAGHTVIPYRDSVLTTVLQESLNARSYLTLLACISPHACDLSETNSTLHFAKSAKRLKLTRNQNNLIQIHQQQKRFAAAATNATPAAFRRLLPSSTAIKRMPPIRPAGLSSFCNNKKMTHTLHRTRSEMGLTPKAKDHARQQLNIIERMPLIDVSTCSNTGFPTYRDYLDLKMKAEELQRQLDSIQAQSLGQASSVLSFGDSNSTLCSITEEETIVSNAPNPITNCPLFTSSPTNLTGIAPLSMMSDNNSFDSTIVNIPVSEHPVVVAHGSKVRRTESIKGDSTRIMVSNDLVQPRRSARIAIRNQQNLSESGFSIQNPGTANYSQNLLKLFNNGTIKDLQKLPVIGPKTAYLIVVQRNVMGGFRNWQQIKGLPIWFGSSWNRFATYNSLNILDTN